MPECSICFSNKINYNNKCFSCKKSICDDCFIQMIKMKTNDNTVVFLYDCAFCRSPVIKRMNDVDTLISEKMISKSFSHAKNLLLKTEEQNAMMREKIEEMENTIEYLEALKEQFLIEMKFKPNPKKEKTIQDVIKEFEKKGRKTIKIEELKKMI